MDTPDNSPNRTRMRLQKLGGKIPDSAGVSENTFMKAECHNGMPENISGPEQLSKISENSSGMNENPPSAANPFTAVATQKPLVAVCGSRNGYLMLATHREILNYGDLPDSLFLAARTWASTLEKLGAPRVYWITLSEVTNHLHIHLYPRWPEDSLRGVPLFEARDSAPQPAWSAPVKVALAQWAQEFEVEVVVSD